MIKIFTDFDGTITLRDVGDAMFETFGGVQCRQIIQDYRDEIISAVECFRRECAACSRVNVRELDAFLDAQEIDSTFADFVTYCRHHQFECTIVSDGMDYYIRHILDRNGLGDVPFYANVLRLAPVDGTPYVRFEPEFPYTDELCDRCACSKRNLLLTLSGDDDTIVYVGEGYSDRCPAKYADVVFAKDELLTYCQDENISYYEYRTFADIRERLEKLQDGKNRNITGLRKRRQAERARRDVFIGE